MSGYSDVGEHIPTDQQCPECKDRDGSKNRPYWFPHCPACNGTGRKPPSDGAIYAAGSPPAPPEVQEAIRQGLPKPDVERWSVDDQMSCNGIITVVRASDYDALAAECAAKDARIAELLAALHQAISVIQTWHNMDGGDEVWPIYYRSSPEMRLIREALPPMEVPRG